VTNEPTVHPTALPNDLPVDRLRHRPGVDGSVAVDPASAGWRYLRFRTAELGAGTTLGFGTPEHEACVVVIGGGGIVVRPPDADPIELAGRASPFDGPPEAVYLPVGARRAGAQVIGSSVEARPADLGGRVRIALAEAPRARTTGVASGPLAIRADAIGIEIRGAGRSTRQINHIVPPEFPADRLLLVEVLTPAGNWSSWPPHKHDLDDMPAEAVLEEVYHYRFRRPAAWAIQRVYRPAGGPLGPARDGVWAVGDGDVVLVTDGYHPFAATEADDAYYLNALAGDRRTMACSFDPALDHVRARWASDAPDPRVPLTARAG
jgi:5-deoxy-glucuronate isomerase